MQALINHLAAIPGLAAHTGQRIWIGQTPPELAEYNPSQGVALLINGPGAPAYVPRFDYRGIARLYGPSKPAIVAAADQLCIYGDSFSSAYGWSKIISLAVYLTEPDTNWLTAVLTIEIAISLQSQGVTKWP